MDMPENVNVAIILLLSNREINMRCQLDRLTESV